MTTHEDPVEEIAAHAAGVLRAALAAGSHAATLLAQRQTRRASNVTTQAERTTALADARRHALERVRALPPTDRPPGRAAAAAAPSSDLDSSRWGQIIADAAGPELADTVARSATMPALISRLETLQKAGANPEIALRAAVTDRGFTGVHDPAAVLHHRLSAATPKGESSGSRPARTRPAVVPGYGAGVPPLARTAPRGAASPPGPVRSPRTTIDRSPSR